MNVRRRHERDEPRESAGETTTREDEHVRVSAVRDRTNGRVQRKRTLLLLLADEKPRYCYNQIRKRVVMVANREDNREGEAS